MYQASTLRRRYACVHGALLWKRASVVSTKGRLHRRSTNSSGSMQPLAPSVAAQAVGNCRGASGAGAGSDEAPGGVGSAVATGAGVRGWLVALRGAPQATIPAALSATN